MSLGRVTIKGQPNEKAVLCTSKTTFALKHVETTNTLFIVPRPSQAAAVEASERVTVTATAAAHIEVVPTAPRFAALDRILEVCSCTPHTWLTCHGCQCIPTAWACVASGSC